MQTYIATNTLNGKFYIGSAINFEKRKRQHLRSKSNRPFHSDLRKNPEAFEWKVWTDDASDSTLERALLEMWYGKEQCYNMSPAARERGMPIQVTDPHGESASYSSIQDAVRSTGISRRLLRRWVDGRSSCGKWRGWRAEILMADCNLPPRF